VTSWQSDTSWVKATRSGVQGDCVELRRHSGGVEVRDSKDPHGPVLRFTPSEFTAWLDAAKHAEFDHLTRP
jgi:hypothetical protein